MHCTPEHSGTKGTTDAGVHNKYSIKDKKPKKPHVKIIFKQLTQAFRDQKIHTIGLFIQSKDAVSSYSCSSIGFPRHLSCQD